MAVVNIERRARELGRIRMGDKGDRGQPRRLTTFRLTSADRALLEAAAARYGGQVRPWEAQPGQWELYTEASELPCLIAPQEVSQWYELWSGGGCKRRCDGVTATVAGERGTVETVACPCDPEKRECGLVTRLSVMLHELPGVGTWRLETKGYYAATELPASADILIGMARGGHFPPAALAIEERIVRRDGQTKKFPVPVIRIRQALGTLMTGEIIDPPALGAGAPALPSGSSGAPESTGDRRALQGGHGASESPAEPPSSQGRERARGAMAGAEQSRSYAQEAGAGTPAASGAERLKGILDEIQAQWHRQFPQAKKEDLKAYGERVLGRAAAKRGDLEGQLADYGRILADLKDRPTANSFAAAAYTETGADPNEDGGDVMRAEIARVLGRPVASRKELTAAELRQFGHACKQAAGGAGTPDMPDVPDAPEDETLEAEIVADGAAVEASASPTLPPAAASTGGEPEGPAGSPGPTATPATATLLDSESFADDPFVDE